MDIDTRLDRLNWNDIAAALDQRGWVTTGPLLTADERRRLIASYVDERRFRSTVVMARHGYGRGEYRYFAYPLPELVMRLRERLYGALLPIANRWRQALRQGEPFPATYAEFLAGCRAAGQKRPTPLLLRYGAGRLQLPAPGSVRRLGIPAPGRIPAHRSGRIHRRRVRADRAKTAHAVASPSRPADCR
jgi:hypothetical protein